MARSWTQLGRQLGSRCRVWRGRAVGGAALVLAGCHAAAPAASGAGIDLPAAEVAAPTVPEHLAWHKAGSAMVLTPIGASSGAQPGPVLLTLDCRNGALVVIRHTAAPRGAQALLAVEGKRAILRLAVDAVDDAADPRWQGAIAADTREVEAFAGPFSATLPGGGRLAAPGSAAVADLLRACRAQLHNLPKRAS